MLLRFFKSNRIDKEVTTNPGIIYDLKTPIDKIRVHGIGIGDDSLLIQEEDISTTTFEGGKRPQPGTVYKSNKVYRQIQNKLIEYPLRERIEVVLNSGGIIHMKSGTKFVIRNKTIVGIGLHDNMVKPYQPLRKTDIERKFGKADKINETHEEFDGTLFYTEFKYFKRQLTIVFDDWDHRIILINFGKFYDYHE